MATAALASDRSFTRLNPVTGETATTAPAFGVEQANAAVDAAAAAFPAWSAMGPNARRAKLNAAADAWLANGEYITTIRLSWSVTKITGVK